MVVSVARHYHFPVFGPDLVPPLPPPDVEDFSLFLGEVVGHGCGCGLCEREDGGRKREGKRIGGTEMGLELNTSDASILI